MTTLQSIRARDALYPPDAILTGEKLDRRILLKMVDALQADMSVLDAGVLSSADQAFMTTIGSQSDKVRAAIWAYLWALRARRVDGDWILYPSFDDLRRALADWQTEQSEEARAE